MSPVGGARHFPLNADLIQVPPGLCRPVADEVFARLDPFHEDGRPCRHQVVPSPAVYRLAPGS